MSMKIAGVEGKKPDLISKAEIQALTQPTADAEDAARYRRLFDGPYPFCFLGETYNTKAEADAAIDATRTAEDSTDA